MAKQMAKDGANSVAKSCRKFGKLIQKHLEKIAKDPNSRDVNHWKHEIKNWKRLQDAGDKLLGPPPAPPIVPPK